MTKNRVVKIEKTKHGGCKDNQGKAQLDMVPLVVLALLAEPLEAGSEKGYDRHNWFKGISFMQSKAALMRHLAAWDSGEDTYVDTLEDGKKVVGSHINAAFFNLMNIAVQTHFGRNDLDDRWIKPKLDKNLEKE